MSLASLFKTGKTRVIELINADNDLALIADEVTLYTPSVSTEHDRNTFLRLDMERPDGTGMGSIDIYYNRLDVTQELSLLTYGATSVLLDIFGYDTLHQAIDVINIETGLGLTTADVADVVFDKSEPTSVIDVPIRSSSLVYTGTLEINAVNVDWAKVRGVTGGGVRSVEDGTLRGIV